MAGWTLPDTSLLEAAFAENFALRGEIGAACSVWIDGREALHLAGGRTAREPDAPAWTAETLAPVWSATKGPAALTLLHILREAGLDPDAPVRAVWPELGASVTFGEMLSHQAGLAALDDPPSVLDHPAVAAALARQTPAWPPGARHGYHPRTFGPLVEECVRRLTGGRTAGEAWRERVAGPIGADFWIGLPASEHFRVARVYPGKVRPPPPEEEEFHKAAGTPGTPTRRAFSSPAGLHAVAEMNRPEAWTAGLAAFGGVGSARGLAAVYSAAALSGEIPAVPAELTAWLSARLVNGLDATLLVPTAFSAGCMMDPLDESGAKLRRHFGSSLTAFGHPGAGGSHAFADPERRLSFAYVMNQMEQGVLPNEKCLSLIRALEASLLPPG